MGLLKSSEIADLNWGGTHPGGRELQPSEKISDKYEQHLLAFGSRLPEGHIRW
jgi:hypothetical protein